MVNSLSRKRLNRTIELAQRAHAHRVCPMHTQAKPWDALRGQQLGVAFRRQVSIGERYIADFVAPSLEAALVEQRLQAVVAAVVAAVEAARVG